MGGPGGSINLPNRTENVIFFVGLSGFIYKKGEYK